jgi:SAM-dependent methyltransferase
MKNVAAWRPTKYVRTAQGLRASDDAHELAAASRLVGDILARTYDAALRAHARGRLLDLGCGQAPLFASYRDLVDDVVCVDRGLAPGAIDHLDRVCDLDEPLPFPDASFDTILCTDVLEHLRRPDAAVAEVARLLRSGGKLIVGVPFLYWIHEDPHDYHRYTEYKLRAWCAEHRLDVIALEPYGGAPEVLLDMTAKALGRSPWLSALHLRAGRAVSRTRAWRRLSRASARRFPLGYCLVAEARR